MSNFRIGDWEAHLEFKPGMLGWLLYLQRRTPNGSEFLTESGKIVKVIQGEQFKETDMLHFAYFQDDGQLQAIADAISERGIKSQNDHKNEGLLEAKDAHLQDMRRLVFKQSDGEPQTQEGET